MKDKPEIVFTFPACMGGVSSFNYNIINYSEIIKRFYAKVVLLKEESDTRPLFRDRFRADEVIQFQYSDKENQYYVQKRLNKILGTAAGAIVTDNGLTIQAARRFNNPKTVFQLIHDEYYVKLNAKMGNLVDVAVAHSSFFSDAVIATNPDLYLNRCFYIPYGVKQLKEYPAKEEGKLNLVFLGRLDHSKGVLLLHDINKELEKAGVAVNWNIIGKGELKKQLQEQWQNNSAITFREPDTTEEVFTILKKQDIFIFPSSYEGTPVSILECIACAVVTIVSDLPGGIRDIVKEGIGYRCELNNVKAFAESIIILNADRPLLKKMQHNCYSIAQSDFDIERNADNYFSLFMKYGDMKRLNKEECLKMSRLDKPQYPNRLVKLIRTFRSSLHA